MKTMITGGAVAAALGLAIAAVPAPASAQLARPNTAAAIAGQADLMTEVQYRGRHGHGGWRGGSWRGHRGWGWHGNRGWYGPRYRPWIGPAIGFGTGLAIGGALATPYYAPPAVVYDSSPDADEIAYCSRRFKSYDPRSGTYLGYDGNRHPCP